MKQPKESIIEIGNSIKSHVEHEYEQKCLNKAIGRVYCTIINEDGTQSRQLFWLINGDTFRPGKHIYDITGSVVGITTGQKIALSIDGNPVSKNSKLGELFIKYFYGNHEYYAPHPYRRKVLIKKGISIHNRTSYKCNLSDPAEVEIRIANDPATYRYQRLSHLLNAAKAEEARLKKQIEELKRIEEEKTRLARELEEKKAREEQARIEALRIQKEVEERKMRAEIARIEQAQAQLIEQEKAVRSFMRKNVTLRSQNKC